MKKTVVDLEQVHVPLDAEDAELFAMFPRHREWAVNDMVLVHRRRGLLRKRDELYMERKADIAIRRKRAKALAQWLIGLTAGTCLAFEIFSVLQGSGHMWIWAGMFLVCALPTLAKVPPEVTGGNGKKRCGLQQK